MVPADTIPQDPADWLQQTGWPVAVPVRIHIIPHSDRTDATF
jgi:hypothetical protein